MSSRPFRLRCQRCTLGLHTRETLARHAALAHPGLVPLATDLRPAGEQRRAPWLDGKGRVLVVCIDCGGSVPWAPGERCACGWRVPTSDAA